LIGPQANLRIVFASQFCLRKESLSTDFEVGAEFTVAAATHVATPPTPCADHCHPCGRHHPCGLPLPMWPSTTAIWAPHPWWPPPARPFAASAVSSRISPPWRAQPVLRLVPVKSSIKSFPPWCSSRYSHSGHARPRKAEAERTERCSSIIRLRE